ncbi:alpha/beta fold hydrolase [Luteococcus sp. OSA5]|uniref:alpha/beta hydrolase n=1 Tax=Luteococcus sp. OSA5 TaxID=3401630 RepID=UPI003B428C22
MTAVGAAAGLVAGLSPTGATQAVAVPPQRSAKETAAVQAIKNPRVAWRRCAPGLQCGELTVPLDYQDLDKGVIKLPITRRPADQPKRRIGSLFTNPGGPGGPATQTVPYFSEVVGSEVRARFDVVGLAPRGVEGEDYALCEGDLPGADDAVARLTYPLNADEANSLLAGDEKMRKACAKGPEILKHMSTADVARDMDLARRALGDKKLTYYGVSYGSYLGATYAAMFPGKIRALVVDGVLDPVAWSTGHGREGTAIPVTERILSGQGAKQAFEALLDECERVGTSRCPEAGTLRRDWHAIMAALADGPVDLGEDVVLREDDVVGMVTTILYSYEEAGMLPQSLHGLATQLGVLANAQTMQASSKRAEARNKARKAEAEQKARAALQDLRESASEAERSRPAGKAKQTGAKVSQAAQQSSRAQQGRRGPGFVPLEGPAVGGTEEEPPAGPMRYDASFHGVLCSDSVNPSSPSAWLAANQRVREENGGFGQLWLWSSSVCAGWPAQAAQAYRGPFTKKTSAPVLVMTSEYDPATPASGAQAYRGMLKTSRLVTVKGAWAHATLGLSQCSDKIRTRYLVTGKAPARDVVCQPDHPLFTQLD